MHENITLKEIQDKTIVLVYLLYYPYQRTQTCSKNEQGKRSILYLPWNTLLYKNKVLLIHEMHLEVKC